MRTREKGYPDYQFAPGEEVEIEAACKGKDVETVSRLFLACMKANPDIAVDLVYCLSKGVSYDRAIAVAEIPINRVDFYAYRRAAMAHFRDMTKS